MLKIKEKVTGNQGEQFGQFLLICKKIKNPPIVSLQVLIHVFETKEFKIYNFVFNDSVSVTRKDIFISNLPKNLNNFKIVHLSDLHYHDESTLSKETLNQMVDIIKNEKSDLNLFTGDFIHFDSQRAATELSEKLQSIPNKYGVTGDHDLFQNGDLVRWKLTNIGGFKILDNNMIENVVPGINLIGFGNSRSGQFKPELVLPRLTSNNINIAMSHNPSTAECLLNSKTCNYNVHLDLQLSGHTHAGQANIPFTTTSLAKVLYFHFNSLFNFILGKLHMDNVVENWNWDQGLFEFGAFRKSYLYVSRGIGSHKGFRFFCRPEVAILTLKSTSKE